MHFATWSKPIQFNSQSAFQAMIADQCAVFKCILVTIPFSLREQIIVNKLIIAWCKKMYLRNICQMSPGGVFILTIL